MAVFLVETWNVAHEKQHEEIMKRVLDYYHENAERFKLRSLRYYSEAPGFDPRSPRRVMVFEYDSPEDIDRCEDEMMEDKKLQELNNELRANISNKLPGRTWEWRDKLRESWFG